jgi:LysM repeat protein
MESHYKRFFSFRNEFWKEPGSFLGIISVVLFSLVIFSATSFFESHSDKGDFSIAALSGIFESNSKEDVFTSYPLKVWSESPEFLLVGNSSLKAVSPPTTFSPKALGALVGGVEMEDTKKVITEYIVESGDSLYSIAAQFNISLDTILWANDLNKNSLLQTGQKLIILPVSGVIHHVKNGDTISEIAETYGGKIEKIISFNNLSGEGDIYIGDIIIVPDGEMPTPSVQYAAPQRVPLADSYFICPISQPCRITQGLHWYNAIDFSHGKCGEPIYAAAAGTVLKVKLTNSTSKWAYGGAGNHLTILHPNGVVTMYGHIATSLVSPGEQVSQGQVIALMGGQPGTPGAGLSSGCHIHFGVSGARNPFTY